METVIDGHSITVQTMFLDDYDTPLIPATGYPQVAFLDTDKSVLFSASVNPGASPGQWEATIALPELGVTKATEYTVRWRLRAVDGERHTNKQPITVVPKADHRDTDVVVMTGETMGDVVLPLEYQAAYNGSFQIYAQNKPQYTNAVAMSDPGVTLDIGKDRTFMEFTLPTTLQPTLTASLLTVKMRVSSRPKMFNYNVYLITPQIALAATAIENFLNKSKVENVIPELEYTYSDLVHYLERGLYLFNMTGSITSFNGLNMQGVLYDAWVICACYWALGAQLLAEGSLSFDFSGQGVSLNVDRTPQLDSALGRIEARIQDTVLPLKKHLASQGILGGDGSQGATALRNSYSLAHLGLTNTMTTRISGISGYYGNSSFRRG